MLKYIHLKLPKFRKFFVPRKKNIENLVPRDKYIRVFQNET